ncbi:MlaD family protein [Luteimonas sp. FXH3W]|uniref:MlaD family protein n=1 Tax=Aquilutibacter rugosus TaxID=3115820 RepID=A0ABU7UYW0_9GAMM
METKANYVLIGAFTLLVSLFVLMFALWAAKYSSDREWQDYSVLFSEPVTGLAEGSSVAYNGISVGTVKLLRLDPQDPRRVTALLRLYADAPVKVDTFAKIATPSLTGAPIIQLTGGSPQAKLLREVDTSEAPLIKTEPSALQNIQDTANKLVQRVDTLVSEENIASIAASLRAIEDVTGTVAAERAQIALLMRGLKQNSDQLAAALNSTNSAINGVNRNLVDQLPALTARLDGSLVRLQEATGNANSLLAENRGPIREFTQDGLAQIGPTMKELRATARELRILVDNLNESPIGFIRGRNGVREFDPATGVSTPVPPEKVQ